MTRWTAALQDSLSKSNSRSLCKLMSIESVMPSSHLILCCPLLLLASIFPRISSVQFSSVAQSCLAFCDPMNCNTPGLPFHHQLLEFTQTHVHQVGDAIQPSYPPSSPSPPAPNPSQHQSLSNESALGMRWPKYWSFSFSFRPSNEHPGLIS